MLELGRGLDSFVEGAVNHWVDHLAIDYTLERCRLLRL
jgi:hypothetical protein